MLNEITYEKHFNSSKGNRVEFWITNFDYFDGIDCLAKLFCKKYQMQADEKVEGIFFDFIRVHTNDIEYVLMWHEDIGTLIYNLNQNTDNIAQLEAQLSAIVQEINSSLSGN